MFDRLYQENWLEQVTTKKGQSNWSIASLCSELVAKMAKDIGMTIRKGIVVPFLPCLVAFWGFHPYMFFLNVFFVTLNISLRHWILMILALGVHNPKGRSIKLVIPHGTYKKYGMPSGYAWLIYYTASGFRAILRYLTFHSHHTGEKERRGYALCSQCTVPMGTKSVGVRSFSPV